MLTLKELVDTHKQNGLGLMRAKTESVLEELAKPLEIERDLHAKLDSIRSDQHLTDDGRGDRVREVVRSLSAALKQWHAGHQDGLTRNRARVLDEMRAAITPAPSSDVAFRVEQALLRGEVRRAAAGLDQDGLEQLYRQGDAVTRAALEEAPLVAAGRDGGVVVRTISPELRENVLLDVAGQVRPDLTERLRDLGVVERVYGTAAGLIEQQMRAVKGLP